MFSKKESKHLRELFWTSFGKSFPIKWMLYQTRLNGIALKFHFDLEKAIVALDVEGVSEEKRLKLWEKLVSLKTLLRADYLPNAKFDEEYPLENGKRVSRIYVEKDGVCIHGKQTWKETMLFLKENMALLEEFLMEYRDILEA